MKNKKGFTIIELSVYLSVFSVLSLLLTSLLFYFLKTNYRNQALKEVELSGREAMEIISSTVRYCDSISSPSYGQSSSTLVMACANAAKNPTSFYSENNNFYIKEGNANPVILHSSSVYFSNISFTNLASSSSSQDLSASFDVYYKRYTGNKIEYDYKKNFKNYLLVRNKQ